RHRNSHANCEREKNGPRIQLNNSWAAADVERFHCGGHQSNRASGHKAAKRKPDQRSCNAEAGRVADECGENNTLPGAEGAHDFNTWTAPNDRQGKRVVEKESAKNEINVAQEP